MSSWTWCVSVLEFSLCIHPTVDVLSLHASRHVRAATFPSSMSSQIVMICAMNSRTLFVSIDLRDGGM